MPHGNRPEKTPRTALESAAHDLGRSTQAIRASAGGSLAFCRDGEAEALRDWARARELVLDPFEFLSPAWTGGEEHLVWHDETGDRYIKLTKANAFGLTVAAEWFIDDERDEAELKPALRGAMPSEYLDRLLLQNEIFGDEVELLGIIDKRQALHVVTSQPTIRGGAASPEEISDFMHRLGFRLLPELHIGRLGALSFFHERDGIAAFDCHAANYLVSGRDIVPIDVLLVRANDDLLTALAL